MTRNVSVSDALVEDFSSLISFNPHSNLDVGGAAKLLSTGDQTVLRTVSKVTE